MKMPSSVSKLLTNRYVLYLVALLALFNVIGYMMMDKTQIVILFILVGYLMTHFSKNMVIVLLVPLVLVNLLTSGMMMKEGFSEGVDGDSTTNTTTTTTSASSATPAPSATPTADNTNVASDAASTTNTTNSIIACGESEKFDEKTGKCVAMGATAETFASAGGKKGSSRVDMGSTLEQAYDDLNSVLGSDGIKNLTADTQNLMKQQLHLAEAMKEMGPLMQQAQSMLKTLNIDGIGDLPSLIKKFGINTTALPTSK
jgi:hypothetical protein